MRSLGLVSLPSELPATHERRSIAGGNFGIAQTISEMQKLVSHGKRDFRIRSLAIQLTQSCTPKNYVCYAKQCFLYCRDQIKYVWDPNGVELIENPWRIVESGGADCDSIVVLLASLLESIGFHCEFVTVAANESDPFQYSHVFLRAHAPPYGWIDMDPTMPNKSFGWGPSKKFKRKTWNASKDAPEAHGDEKMNGLSGMGNAPGTEATVGAKPGSVWSWRTEAFPIETTPHDIETNLISDQTMPDIGGRREEFLTIDQAKQLFDGPPESVMGEFPNVTFKTLAISAGFAAAVLFLIGRSR